MDGTPVCARDGIDFTGESYKQVVKLTFARCAVLDVSGPTVQLESGWQRAGNVRRAIDIREGETLDEAAFKTLIQAAVAANVDLLAQGAAKKKK